MIDYCPGDTLNLTLLHDYVIAHGFGPPSPAGRDLARRMLDQHDDYATIAAEIVFRGLTLNPGD